MSPFSARPLPRRPTACSAVSILLRTALLSVASLALAGALTAPVQAATGAASSAVAGSSARGSTAASSAVTATSKFGTVWTNWTRFDDPEGLYALYIPPNWEWRQDKSDKNFNVFYGPGEADVFWVETFTLDYAQPPLTLLQGMFGIYANGESALKDFAVVQNPTTGYLDNLPMAYGVYRYADDKFGPTTEGIAFVVWQTQVVAITFSDSPSSFVNQTPLFNRVLEGVRLHLVQAAPTNSANSADSTNSTHGAPAPAPADGSADRPAQR